MDIIGIKASLEQLLLVLRSSVPEQRSDEWVKQANVADR